uniref:3-hydroxyisobutyryl-CoA hydrolase-like protein 1, mitochondrial n=1 Tax=Nicotiana sylvestris TaxID=4096 RepID=A0A1U7W7Q6_NICSY|nr:PREDICTED: 3-hydroxyisobutyryl-CoA hydrolase-like protein 1, mitochondrial [Nicotiana sylvestris]
MTPLNIICIRPWVTLLGSVSGNFVCLREMQRFRSLLPRPVVRRSLCTLSNTDVIVDPVIVEGKGSNRTVILNRPSVLNALNYSILSRLWQLYRSWEDDPAVGFLVLKVIS